MRRIPASAGRVRCRSLLLLAACAALAPLPAQGLAVGHTSRTFVDPARNNRQVPTEIFYPAEVAGDDVPLADPGPAGFPVIAFGHGYLMAYDRYAYLWQGLVPEGFIVALPRTEGNLFPSHAEFGRDLAFLLLALQEEAGDPGSIFYGGVAAAGAVAGHSMGGGASLLAARGDPAVAAVFNLAAAETNPSAIAAAGEVTAPALLFSGSHDCVTPPADHQIPMYQALAADCRALVSLTGGSHCQFAEQSTICELGEGGCTPPAISRGEQHALTLQLLLPWLRHTLKQAPGAWGEFQALLEGLGGITFLLDCAPAAMVFAPTSPGRPGSPSPRLQAELWPNPAAGPVEIRFRHAGEAHLTVDVWSVGGRRVRTLLDGRVAEGAQRLVWDGLDGQARRVPAGLYWVRLRTPRDTDVRSLLKIR